MDQCGNCTLKGDLTECKKAPCNHHETWYARVQQDRIIVLECALKAIAGQEGATATGAFAEKQLALNKTCNQ